MADYGYKNGGNGYNAYGSAEPQTYKWRKPGSYSNGDNNHSNGHNNDHVCRPMIVDAEGRPLSFPPNTYVTKTETIIEEIETRPMISDYYGGPRAEPYGTDGRNRHLGSRPLSPKGYNNRPPKVEEFITKVQTGVIPGHHETAGYGHNERKPNSRDEWKLPHGGGANRNDYLDGYVHEPPRHGHGLHETPLSKATHDIGTAVEYLKEAASIVKPPSRNAAAPVSKPRFRVSVPAVTRRETAYVEPVDDNVPRYGNYNLPGRRGYDGENYNLAGRRGYDGENYNLAGRRGYDGEVIDSREVLRRYNGAAVE